MAVDKEKTIEQILSKSSPFVGIDEIKLRKKASMKGGVKFIKECAKFVRADIVYT